MRQYHSFTNDLITSHADTLFSRHPSFEELIEDGVNDDEDDHDDGDGYDHLDTSLQS